MWFLCLGTTVNQEGRCMCMTKQKFEMGCAEVQVDGQPF